MENTNEPSRVLPISGLIFSEGFAMDDALKTIGDRVGEVFMRSPVRPFHTDYYNREMGDNILRQWIAFKEPVAPDTLGELKRGTNEIEKMYLNETGGRRINIDPGLLSLHNLVLASTKDFAHRIYLGGGIFGEVTLIYREKRFHPLEWTYPDYREDSSLRFFSEVRRVLKQYNGE